MRHGDTDHPADRPRCDHPFLIALVEDIEVYTPVVRFVDTVIEALLDLVYRGRYLPSDSAASSTVRRR